MKSTSIRYLLACCAALFLFSASAHAVIYQAESFNSANDTTTGTTLNKLAKTGDVVKAERGYRLPG